MKEVAESIVVQPLNRNLHNNTMSEVMIRVLVTEVVPELRAIEPPCNLREPTNTWTFEIAPSGSKNGRRPKFFLERVFKG